MINLPCVETCLIARSMLTHLAENASMTSGILSTLSAFRHCCMKYVALSHLLSISSKCEKFNCSKVLADKHVFSSNGSSSSMMKSYTDNIALLYAAICYSELTLQMKFVIHWKIQSKLQYAHFIKNAYLNFLLKKGRA